eukprot:gene30534-19817_t
MSSEESEAIRADFAAITQGLTNLLTAAGNAAEALHTRPPDDDGEAKEQMDKLGADFTTSLKELQARFQSQVIRIEDNRTAQPPVGSLYGHEMDGRLAAQATTVLKERIDIAIAASPE